MPGTDMTYLLPYMFMAGGAVLLMLFVAFFRHYTLGFFITLVSLAATAWSFLSMEGLPVKITSLIVMDSYSLFYSLLILFATIAVLLMSFRHLDVRPGIREEYFILLLLSCLGSLVLVGANHLATLFLGLELLGVSLYGLISYQRMTDTGIEAGIKYLVLAGASSAIMIFGMALIYYETGSMEFADIASALGSDGGLSVAGLAGIALTVVGIGFKLGAVPFHMWTPDVYEGAPAPIAAFIATVSKGSMFALLVRYFANVDIIGPIFTVFTVTAIASMLAGNLLALFQDNVKRLLAYSSISHMGYALVAFLAFGQTRISAVTFYLVTYFITELGAFGVVVALSGAEREADSVEDYRGLYRRSPLMTFVFSLFLLSLAGLPLTAGFVGKFYAVSAGVGSGQWLSVISLCIGSAIGLYYYLRVLIIMYIPSKAGEEVVLPWPGVLQMLVLALLAVGLLWVGIYPGGLISAISSLSIGM